MLSECSSHEGEYGRRRAAPTRGGRRISETSRSRGRLVTRVDREIVSEGEDVCGVYERRRKNNLPIGKHRARSFRGIRENKNRCAHDCLLQSKDSISASGSLHVRSSTTDIDSATASANMLARQMRNRIDAVRGTIDNMFEVLLRDISLLALSAASDEKGCNVWVAQLLSETEGCLEAGQGSQVASSSTSVEISRQGVWHPQHQRGRVRAAQESPCGSMRSDRTPGIAKLIKQGCPSSTDRLEVESEASKGSEQDRRGCRSFDCESDNPRSVEQKNLSFCSFDCESDASRRAETDAPLGVWELEEQMQQELFEAHSLCAPHSFDCESDASRRAETDAPLGVWELEDQRKQERFEAHSLCAASKASSESGRRKSPIRSWERDSQVRSKGPRSVPEAEPVSNFDKLLPEGDASLVEAEECPDEAPPGFISTVVRHAESEPPPKPNTGSSGAGADCARRDLQRGLTYPVTTRRYSYEGALPTYAVDFENSGLEGQEPEGLIRAQVWRRRFAILPLVVCGLCPRDVRPTQVPLRLKKQWRALAYQSFMTVVVFVALVAYVWRLSGRGGPSDACVVKSGTISEIAIALGSLMGLCSIHLLALGPRVLDSVRVLQVNAARQGVCGVWAKRSCLDTCVTLAFWAGGVLLRVCASGLVTCGTDGSMEALDFRGTLAFIVVSGTVLSLGGIILYVNRAMVLLVDGFCASSMACNDIDWQATARAWNLIQSVLRHTCRMIQVCFAILQVTVFASVVCIAVELWTSKQMLLDTLIAVAPTFILCAGLTRTLFFAADVTNRCDRIPSLISSSQADSIIDAAHHYFLNYLSSCAAGFYVFGARLTSVIALKFLYILSALGFAALSKLAD